MSKKQIIDLKSKNLSFEENGQKIKLLAYKKSSMTLDIAVYEKEVFIKNSSMVFAHLPKKLKSLLNPL